MQIKRNILGFLQGINYVIIKLITLKIFNLYTIYLLIYILLMSQHHHNVQIIYYCCSAIIIYFFILEN